MAEVVRDFWAGMPLGMYIILLLAVALIIASWAVPPLGVISSSSLQGTALILGGSWLFYVTCNIPTILASGAKIRASYGNAKIEIGRKHNNEEKDNQGGEEAEYTEERYNPEVTAEQGETA